MCRCTLKNDISQGDIAIRETDIRPDRLLERYLELARRDARTLFPPEARLHTTCPGCGKNDPRPAFEKDGFALERCGTCESLYVSPRPFGENLERFYRESESSRYWGKTFFPAVAEARQEKLFTPKAERVAAMCQADGFIPRFVVEAGAGFGIFLSKLGEIIPLSRAVAVEPQPDMARRCQEVGLDVVEGFAGNEDGLRGAFDLAISMEVIEHVSDTLDFVRSLRDMIRPGGRVLVTGLCCEGFDIAVLGKNSRAICPPQHLNFLSLMGYRALFARAGLTVLEINTPGRLDVDIVRNAAGKTPSVLDGQPFVASLLQSGKESLTQFQEYLSRNRLSSHLWVWATRKEHE